jgi:Zn-dependent protease with chaperone function
MSDLLAGSGPALAAGIANHLWQSSAVGLAILGLLGLARNSSARTRRTLARLALVKFAIPIGLAISLFRNWEGAGEGTLKNVSTALPVPHPAGTWTVLVQGADLDSPLVRECLGLVGCLWVAGFMVLAGIWTIRSRRFRRHLLAAAEPLPRSQDAAVWNAAERTGLRSPPRCLMVGSSCGPGVLGIISPVVVLPRGIQAILSAQELDTILVHEFVHLRSRDHLWNLLQVFLVGAFWFNPIVWLLHRRLNAEVEKSCDERVLAITADPHSYAHGIIKTVRLSLGLPQTGMVGAAMPPVTARLDAILSYADHPEEPLLRLAALSTGLGLLIFSGYSGSIQLEAIRVPATHVSGDRMSAPIREFASTRPAGIAGSNPLEPGNSAPASARISPPSPAIFLAVKPANLPADAITPSVRNAPLAPALAEQVRPIERPIEVRPMAERPPPLASTNRPEDVPAASEAARSQSRPVVDQLFSHASVPFSTGTLKPVRVSAVNQLAQKPATTPPAHNNSRQPGIKYPPMPKLPRIGLIQDSKGASLDDLYYPAVEVITIRHGS